MHRLVISRSAFSVQQARTKVMHGIMASERDAAASRTPCGHPGCNLFVYLVVFYDVSSPPRGFVSFFVCV
jgi:hypothetical protein